jgi:glycosyltransferase involved in cell wall biosynthesis
MQKPLVYFSILNLRMGGQVSNITSLADLLKEAGTPVKFLLPEGLGSLRKSELEAFASLPFLKRLRVTWAILRRLQGQSDHHHAILHLVLPTPAFSWFVHFVTFPKRRILLHYEGSALKFDREHWRVFRDDPCLMLPRMVLGHPWLVRLGRRLPCSHLATHAIVADQLYKAGYRRIHEVPNVSTFQAAEAVPEGSLPELLDPAACYVAYIGHAFPVKGIDDLLTAFTHARVVRPDLRLLLALSSDGNAKRIQRRVDDLGIRDQVIMAGLLPIQTVLSRINTLVLPYRSAVTTTIYPSLLLEANNAQCPVITTDIAAWRDRLRGNSSCLQIVPPRNVEQLTQALRQVPPKRTSPWEPILNLPDANEIIQQMLKIYAGIAAQSTSV